MGDARGRKEKSVPVGCSSSEIKDTNFQNLSGLMSGAGYRHSHGCCLSGARPVKRAWTRMATFYSPYRPRFVRSPLPYTSSEVCA